MAVNSAVVGLCWASGTVTLAALAPLCDTPSGRSAFGTWPAAM